MALVGAGCATDGDAPELDTATPASAHLGSAVVVRGLRFCGPMGDCTNAAGEFQIGTGNPVIRAPLSGGYTDTQATIVVPTNTPLGATQLILTVNDRVSNPLSFDVLQ